MYFIAYPFIFLGDYKVVYNFKKFQKFLKFVFDWVIIIIVSNT